MNAPVLKSARRDEDGENASATVELAMLMPVYLLLVVALLTIGQLVLVRQGMILGARNVAWRPAGGSVPAAESNSAITNSFIPLGNPSGYGSFTSTPTTADVKFAAGGSPELSLSFPSTEDDRVLDSGAGGPNGLHGNNAAMTLAQTGIVVTPAAAVSITVSPLVPSTAGVAQNVTITARDAYGNVATSYRGTLAFSSSDTQVAMLTAYTFTAADAGSHTFAVTFKSSRGQTFTVADTANAAMTYFQRDIMVNAAAMTGFAFRVPSSATAGLAFSVTLTAVDAFGNPIPGYVGKVHFTGPNGIPVDYTFTAADAGSHVFSITFSATGTQTIGVQDAANGSLKGQTSIKVVANGGGGGTGGGGKKP